MVLAIFAGSLLPYLKGLDSWLYEGILDDPYEEVSALPSILNGLIALELSLEAWKLLKLETC